MPDQGQSVPMPRLRRRALAPQNSVGSTRLPWLQRMVEPTRTHQSAVHRLQIRGDSHVARLRLDSPGVTPARPARPSHDHEPITTRQRSEHSASTKPPPRTHCDASEAGACRITSPWQGHFCLPLRRHPVNPKRPPVAALEIPGHEIPGTPRSRHGEARPAAAVGAAEFQHPARRSRSAAPLWRGPLSRWQTSAPCRRCSR